MRTSAPPPKSQKLGRLPVNPRRNHVQDGERKRVKTACNNCNVRRVRCSGEHPCSQCLGAHRPCEYPIVDKKVPVAQSELQELRYARDALKCLLPNASQRNNILSSLAAQNDPTAVATRTTPVKDEDALHSPAASTSTIAMSPQNETNSSQPQPFHDHQGFGDSSGTCAHEGSLLRDHDGTKRWLGGTSGATFLDHLKKFMHTLKSSLGYNETPTELSSPGYMFILSHGQYQTSDSRVLLMPESEDSNYSTLRPSWQVATMLLSKVEEYLQSNLGLWFCGGIHYFGDLSPETFMRVKEQSEHLAEPPREMAFYQAAFALGTVYSLTTANSRRDGQLGETFFNNASKILGDPIMNLSRYNIHDVPTLALMAMYMTEMNRRDNSYLYLCHAISLCCMFGGLRGNSVDERDKRIVWTLFCLTRDASCLMGRPPIYPDEAFQLPPPQAVPGFPPPDGLKAHVELSRIAGYVVSNTYSIAPREDANVLQDPVTQVAQTMGVLYRWRDRLPEHLKVPLELQPELQIPFDDGTETNTLPVDRALCMLHMKWNQLAILVIRPLFFLAVKSSVGGDFINMPQDLLVDRRVMPMMECTGAARRNLRLGKHIYERCHQNVGTAQRPNKLVMLDLHHIFNAAVMLLLHQMVFLNVVNTDVMAIKAARQIFEAEAQAECASSSSSSSSSSGGGGGGGAPSGTMGYASDCLGVLNDLSALVPRIRQVRFKSFEHAKMSEYFEFGSPVGGTDMTLRGDGASSTGTLGSPVFITDEQLAANLGLESLGGFDPEGVFHPDVTQGNGHTNWKEFERWVQEGSWHVAGVFGGANNTGI